MVSNTVRFEEAELYGLSGSERDAAIDALSTGREFPFVIIGGTLACSGGLDVTAIAEVVKGRMPI